MTASTLTETTPTLSVNRKKLLAALNRVGSVIPARTQKAILHGIHLEASGGELWMRGTDLDVSIAACVPCDGELPACVVRCRDLVQRIKSGKGSHCNLGFDEEREALIVNGGRVEHVVQTLVADDFPVVPSEPAGETILVRTEELRSAIKTCLAAAARETTRYALDGILLESDAKGTRLAATDGRRLVVCEMDGVESAFTGQAILPRRLAALIGKLADPKHNEILGLHVKVNPPKDGKPQPADVFVRCHDWQLAAKESEGAFPPYRDLIPTSGSKFLLHRKLFIELLTEVSLATDFECKSVRLDLSADAVRVSAHSAQNGESSGSIRTEFLGGGDDRIIIAFNPRFLLDAVKSLPGDRMVLDVQQNELYLVTGKVVSGPGLICAEDSERTRWLIMAVNLGLEPSPETLGSNYKPDVPSDEGGASSAAA